MAPEARQDLLDLYHWISEKAGSDVALGYIDRIEEFCQKLEIAPERGTLRNDIRSGLRVIGFERRNSIAFIVEERRVVILRILSGGQNWQNKFPREEI